jgi:hypothetical protein
MATKRRKTRKKARRKSTSTRVTVSRAALNAVIHAGAGHHKKLRQLRASVRAAPKKRKRAKR